MIYCQFAGDYKKTIFQAHQISSSAMTALMTVLYRLYRGKSMVPMVAQIRFPVAAQPAIMTAKPRIMGIWKPCGRM